MCAKCKFHDNTFMGLNLNNAPLSCKLMYPEFLQTEEPYELDFLCPNQLKNRFIRTLWELMDKPFFERLRVDRLPSQSWFSLFFYFQNNVTNKSSS